MTAPTQRIEVITRGERQVQPFHAENPVRENVESCVGYAFKFDHRKWSQYASSRLFLWIRQRAALRAMCSVRSGSKSPIPVAESMPVVI